MKIDELLNRVTDFILNFMPEKYKEQVKIVVIAIATLGVLIILGAFSFSMLHQF